MRIVITGGHGFLGWHTACRLRAVHGVDAVRLGRAELADAERLGAALEGVDAVLHLAGVNRADSEREVEEGNVVLGRVLADALRTLERPVDVVYANSVQADLDNPYGRGKAGAAIVLAEATASLGGQFADLLLPNLFGEHGRPAYNSFVATFAHDVAAGGDPVVVGDRAISLLHAQDAAHEVIGSIGRTERRVLAGEERGIGEVLDLLRQAHALYASRGEIPPLPGRFEVNLFNTYRAAAFPQMWPLAPHRPRRRPGRAVRDGACPRGYRVRPSCPPPAPDSCAATTTTCTRSSASSWCAARPRSTCAGCCTTT